MCLTQRCDESWFLHPERESSHPRLGALAVMSPDEIRLMLVSDPSPEASSIQWLPMQLSSRWQMQKEKCPEASRPLPPLSASCRDPGGKFSFVIHAENLVSLPVRPGCLGTAGRKAGRLCLISLIVDAAQSRQISCRPLCTMYFALM